MCPISIYRAPTTLCQAFSQVLGLQKQITQNSYPEKLLLSAAEKAVSFALMESGHTRFPKPFCKDVAQGLK